MHSFSFLKSFLHNECACAARTYRTVLDYDGWVSRVYAKYWNSQNQTIILVWPQLSLQGLSSAKWQNSNNEHVLIFCITFPGIVPQLSMISLSNPLNFPLIIQFWNPQPHPRGNWCIMGNVLKSTVSLDDDERTCFKIPVLAVNVGMNRICLHFEGLCLDWAFSLLWCLYPSKDLVDRIVHLDLAAKCEWFQRRISTLFLSQTAVFTSLILNIIFKPSFPGAWASSDVVVYLCVHFAAHFSYLQNQGKAQLLFRLCC